MKDSKLNNPPAFPTPPVVAPDGTEHDNGQEGMSLRDYFAAKALAGICMYDRRNGYPEPGNLEIKYAAEAAYAYADEMLKARNA